MLKDSLIATIETILRQPPYYPCLLLVHPDVATLHLLSEQILQKYQWPPLSVGTELSERLLSIQPKRRPRQARQAFKELIDAKPPGSPVLCTDIDLLFEPQLSLDPLHLLRQTSRQRNLVVAWPGTFQHQTLAYATGRHAHYQSWYRTDLCEHCIYPL